MAIRTGDLGTDLQNLATSPTDAVKKVGEAIGGGAKGTPVEGMDLREFLKATGWPGSQVENAAAIVARESGGDASANNAGLNSDGSVDIGLFQINSVHGQKNMENPVKNSKYALSLFKARAWRDWYCNESLTACTNGVKVPVPAPKGMKVKNAGGATVEGGIGGIVDNAVDAVTPFDEINSVADGLAVIAGGVSTLFKAETWFRVMKVVGGSLVFLFGLLALLKVAGVSAPIPAVKGAKAIAKAV